MNDVINGWVTEAEEFAVRREDDNGDVGATKEAEFAGFLEEARASFGEGDLFVALIFQFFYFDFPSPLSSLSLHLRIHNDDDDKSRKKKKFCYANKMFRQGKKKLGLNVLFIYNAYYKLFFLFFLFSFLSSILIDWK